MSNKKGIKKVKTDSGKIFYIVSDNKGNYAHGESIKQAREDLIYKRTVDFNGKIPKQATGEDWISIYRQVTGACSVGIKEFIQGLDKDIKETYSLEEVLNISKGQFGYDKFKDKVND